MSIFLSSVKTLFQKFINQNQRTNYGSIWSVGTGARRCSMGSRTDWQDPLVSGLSAFPTEGSGASLPASLKHLKGRVLLDHGAQCGEAWAPL